MWGAFGIGWDVSFSRRKGLRLPSDGVLRTPRIPLFGALACAIGLTITGLLAYLVPIVHARDAVSLQAFIALNRPRLTPLIDHVAHLADPAPYALIGLSLALLALARGRWPVTLAILALLFVNGATTESLKQLLATPRFSEWLGDGQIAAASWPSGHATASMTLALCAVLAAPPRLRPAVAGVGACFAIAVSYAILALGWHFPSDVIGGYLVAAMWTLLAVRGAGRLRGPEADPARAAPGGRGARSTIGAAFAAVARSSSPSRARRSCRLRPASTRRSSSSPRRIAALATGLALVVSGSVPAPTAARRRRSPRGEDEQQVREPVEVAHDLGVGVLDEDRAALGAAADGAADVQVRGGRACRRAGRRTSAARASR